MDASTAVSTAPTNYLLHLADNALILGQRNAEWCGHGPIIEEDLSMANNSLDLIGQARLLYQYAAQQQGQGATEDSLAYFRDVPDFRNYTLVELPHTPPLAAPARADRDYATTIVRNFLYSALMVLVWERLQASPDAQLAAIGCPVSEGSSLPPAPLARLAGAIRRWHR
jgi:ring-1,2-phenylacetyl-CoA epoxidase subunit PaaC